MINKNARVVMKLKEIDRGKMTGGGRNILGIEQIVLCRETGSGELLFLDI